MDEIRKEIIRENYKRVIDKIEEAKARSPYHQDVTLLAATKTVPAEEIIFAIEESPHPAGTNDGTQETMQNLEERLQAEIDGLDDRIEALEEGAVTFTDSDGNGNIVISF